MRHNSEKIFTTLILAAAISLAAASLVQHRKLSKVSRVLETVPLRNDYRSQRVFKLEGMMDRPKFLNDSTIVYKSGNNLYLIGVGQSSPSLEFAGHTGDIQNYAISPDCKRIVTASTDGTLRLWDAGTTRCLAVSARLDTLDQPWWTMMHDVVYLAGGRRILSSDMEGVRIWRASDLKSISVHDTDLLYMRPWLLSPDGRTVCCPTYPEGEDHVYDLRKETPLIHLGQEYPDLYSNDGRLLLTVESDGCGMTLWDTNARTAARRTSFIPLVGEYAPYVTAAFSPDGRLLASAHADGSIWIWNAKNGAQREVLHWEGAKIDAICLDQDGKRILAYDGTKGEYCIWGPFCWVVCIETADIPNGSFLGPGLERAGLGG